MAKRSIPKEIAKDTRLYKHIKAHGPISMDEWKRPSQPFHSLIRSIIYQQVSGKAAASILKKFKSLFGGRFPKPQELLDISVERLRSAGLSGQKATYVKDLAHHF